MIDQRPGHEEKHISDPELVRRPGIRRRGWVHGRFTAFVRAPIDDVWTLVSDADRMPEWEPMSGNIASESADEDAWIAVAPAHRPDGKRIKVKTEFRRRRVTRAEELRPTRVIWWFEYPDAPQWPARMLAVDLSPSDDDDGTWVTLTSTWRRRTGWRRLIGLPLRPLQRFFVWLNLSHAGHAISRVFH